MGNVSYKIAFTGSVQAELSAGINSTVMPLLKQTVSAIAQQVAIDWKESVYRAKLWSGEKDAYAESIKWEMTGDFSAEVVSDYKYAGDIETGRPQRDLKKMLDTSSKVRRTEDGRRFLVIPMRHNTPGHGAHAQAMPGSLYQLANKMTPSRVIGTGKRLSGEVTHLSPKTGMTKSAKQSPFLTSTKTKQAAMVTSRKYAWGDRVTQAMLKEVGMSKQEAKRYAGMVRMDTSTPGGSKSSSYMTFRNMMEGSKGWVIPAQPGQYLARKVAEAMEPKAKAAFQAAIHKTLGGG